MRVFASCICVAFGTSLAGCSEPVVVDHEAEAQELMQLSRDWSDMADSGQLQASIDLWADDAVILPPGLPVISGKEAIREYVNDAAAIPGFSISWEPESAHVSDSGDMAYLLERNVIGMDGVDGRKEVVHGKVLTVWRKDDNGRWRNVAEMWNSAPPVGD